MEGGGGGEDPQLVVRMDGSGCGKQRLCCRGECERKLHVPRARAMPACRMVGPLQRNNTPSHCQGYQIHLGGMHALPFKTAPSRRNTHTPTPPPPHTHARQGSSGGRGWRVTVRRRHRAAAAAAHAKCRRTHIPAVCWCRCHPASAARAAPHPRPPRCATCPPGRPGRPSRPQARRFRWHPARQLPRGLRRRRRGACRRCGGPSS